MDAVTKIRVLVVDDSPDDRQIIQDTLTPGLDYEYEIIEAETGGEAIEKLKTENPDCILLDHQLPDMDGLEFLDQLQGIQFPSPVVMITGKGDEFLALEAIEKGAQDFLVKGEFKWERLQYAIQNSMQRSVLMVQKTHLEKELRELCDLVIATIDIIEGQLDDEGKTRVSELMEIAQSANQAFPSSS